MRLAVLDTQLELKRRARVKRGTDVFILPSDGFHVLLSDIASNSALMRYLKEIVLQVALIIETLKAPGSKLIVERFESRIESIAGGLELSPRPRENR